MLGVLKRACPKQAFFVLSGLALVLAVSACSNTSSTGSTASAPSEVQQYARLAPHEKEAFMSKWLHRVFHTPCACELARVTS